MAKDSNDKHLLEGCLRGDEAAWLEVQAFVFRQMRFKLRNEERAMEFTQRVLVLLLEEDRNGVLNISKVRDPERFRSFLRAFSFSRMIDFIRADKRRQHEDIDSETIRLPTHPSAAVHGEMLEEIELLFRGIEQMKEPCKTLLKQDIYFKIGLTDYDSYSEMFEAMLQMDAVTEHRTSNYTLDKFYVDLHRCKKYLQRYLEH